MLLQPLHRCIKKIAKRNPAVFSAMPVLSISHQSITLGTLGLASLLGFATMAQAQDVDFPDLQERTGEFLSGLNSDSSAKIVELGDFDNDGMEDLVISRTDSDPVLLMNVGGVLTNTTPTHLPGSIDANNSLYVEAFDADSDGWMDVVFGRRDNTPWLMRNLGNDASGNWLGFDPGAEIAGTNNNLVLESGDVNGDGAPDLFAIQVEFSDNDLLINDGQGNFTAESERLGGLGTLTRGHSALLADVEGDGDVDIIYVESDLFLHIYFNDGNAMFNNTMRRTFRNPDNFAYIFGGGDFNGDGIFDFRQYSNPAPNAEMSDGTFDQNGLPNYTVRTDDNMLRGNRKHGTVHIRDIDSDGDLDYVLSSILRNFGGVRNTTEGMRTEMVFNRGLNTGEFVTFVGEDWGSDESYDMKIIDINGDGNLDMFVAHQFRYGVYMNSASAQPLEISDTLNVIPAEAGSPATLVVQLTADSGPATQYSWEFGDGISVTTPQPVTAHTYAQPGRYQVTVTATGPSGTDQASFFQLVHEPLGIGEQVSSMDMVYETRGGNDRIYVVNPDNDSVSVVDAVTNTLLAEIAVGDEPRSLAMEANNLLSVVNKGDASVSRIDTVALTLADEYSLPYASRPHGIVMDAQKQFAYIALEAAGKIVKVDVIARQIEAEVEVGSTPRELSLSADGSTLYAPRFITLPVAGESTRTPALTGGEVMLIDTGNLTLSGNIQIPYNQPPGNVDTEVNARGVPNYLRSLAISPGGTLAILPMKVDNIYRGSMRDGQARAHDLLTRGAMARLDLTTAAEDVTNRFQFDNNSQPTAMAFGPTGNYLFVVHEASRTFEVIDVYSNAIVFSDSLGFAPTGIVVSPDGSRVFVHNWLDRSVSIIDSTDLIAGTSSNADVIATVNLVGNEALSPRVLEGKRLFFDSADLRLAAQKYISCAGCHDEAGHDGRTWDFSDAGEGLRNTIDLRGRAGVGNGNVHWSANFDEIHDFENDIREIFDGTGLLTDADFAISAAPLDDSAPKAGRSAALDALAAYTSTLTRFGQSPHRESDGSLTAVAVTGEQIFVDAGCAACHGGDDFTDSPSGFTHNIGTVDDDTGGQLGQPLLNGGLDTPTLKGLWNGAPYLHDGSAATIEDAILAHTTNVDVNVASLSAAELASLADFVLQIDDSSVAPDDPDLAAALPSEPNANNAASNEASITIGGDLSDWPTDSFITADPLDIGGAANTLDLAGAYMAHDGANVFVRYDNQPPQEVVLTWGYGLYIDIDGEPGYRGFAGDLPLGVDYLLEAGSLYEYTGSGQDFEWTYVRSVPINLVDGAAELSITRTDIGNPASFRYFLIADNASVGGTARDFFPDAAGDASAEADTRSFAYDLGGPATPEEIANATPPVVSSGVLYNLTQGIVADGRDADWARHTSFGIDPDDVSGASDRLDIRQAWMAHNAQEFYIAWTNDGPAEESWGNGVFLDTDQNTGTGFVGENAELPIGVDYLVEGRQLFFYTGTGSDWNWTSVGLIQFGRSGDFTEVAIPVMLLGNPPHIDLFFLANNNSIGGTATDFFPDSVNETGSAQRFFTYTTIESSQTTTHGALAPLVDGDLSDWPASYEVVSVDSENDNIVDTIDWQRALLASDADNLYIAYEAYQPVILNWGYGVYLDTDNSDRTGFKGFTNELPLGADYLVEGTSLFRYNGDSQSEWSWVGEADFTIAADGTGVEMQLPLASIGNPGTIAVLFRGDNTAVQGTSLDFMPDTGVIEFSVPAVTATLVDASIQVEGTEISLDLRADEPELAAALDTEPGPLLNDAFNGESVAVVDSRESGGSGSSGFLMAALLAVLALFRRRMTKTHLLVSVISVTALLSACDSGEYSGGNGSGQPNNIPGFDSAPSLGAGTADSQPNNDPSLAWGIEVELMGTELVPPVSTNEGGGFRLFLDTNTGELQGTLQHTLSNAVAATIYSGVAGTNGPQFLALQSIDVDNGVYEIPGGTFLDDAQQETLRSGGFYVVVHSNTHPGGQLRAQLSNAEQFEIIAGNLVSLQLNVFGPTCSGCHVGGGDTLPSSMNLSHAAATLASLVNVRSLEVPGLSRVLPGNADASYLVHKIEGTHTVGSQMPFRGPPLSAQEMSAVRDWINGGALP